MHDKHTLCISCCGNECTFDNRCSECSDWTDDVMLKYIKLRKPLDSKSRKNKKSDKEREDSFSRSSSVESNATPLGSMGLHSSGGGLSEARVLELISSSIGRLYVYLVVGMNALLIIDVLNVVIGLMMLCLSTLNFVSH